ncbi:MAG: hypothetical protein KDC33_06535 [Thermoleophilia bacterium]|nr:hypothetical protein [Thermoleophilia bacterium]
MSDAGSDETLRQMRAAYDQAVQGWTQVFERWMATDGFAEGSARMLQQYLDMQEGLRSASREAAGRLDLPTVDDIARIATLIANVERKVDELCDQTHEMNRRLAALEGSAASGEPQRLRAVESPPATGERPAG